MSDAIFSLNTLPVFGIVCHPPLSILEVFLLTKKTINHVHVNLRGYWTEVQKHFTHRFFWANRFLFLVFPEFFLFLCRALD